jgi:hypothetical protein
LSSGGEGAPYYVVAVSGHLVLLGVEGSSTLQQKQLTIPSPFAYMLFTFHLCEHDDV